MKKIALIVTLFVLQHSVFADDNNQCAEIDVYAMRHLPKQSIPGEKDPGLSDKGKVLARELAMQTFAKSLDAVFYSPYKRSKESVLYVLESKKIPAIEYDASHSQSLVNDINKNYCQQTVLIVGHSNTVPEIVQLLGGKFVVNFADSALKSTPTIILNEQDYGTIFHIQRVNGKVNQSILNIQ